MARRTSGLAIRVGRRVAAPVLSSAAYSQNTPQVRREFGNTEESGMNTVRPFVIAVTLLLSGPTAFGQDMTRYRVYVLESSLDSVAAASGTPPANAETLHTRPGTIQQLKWRAPYVSSTAPLADPVRDITFSFYNGALYQVVVTYDRDRTEGLTAKDVLEALSTTYGASAAGSARTGTPLSREAFPDSIVLARWESAESLVTLVRSSYTLEYQLILISKPLSTRARAAIREAVRLDAIEAPRRESEQRKKESVDASTAREKVRLANKAAFRP